MALNFSEVHTIGALSLSGNGIYRTSGCPDFVRLMLTGNISIAGRLGDALGDATSTPFVFANGSRLNIDFGNAVSGTFMGTAVSLTDTTGVIQFGYLAVDTPSPVIRCAQCSDMRIRGSAVATSNVNSSMGVNLDECTNLTLEIDEISGGFDGIYLDSCTAVQLSGRRVRAFNLNPSRGRGVIEVEGGSGVDTDDDCIIRFSQVVSVGQRPNSVLTIFNRARVRAYNTLFISQYVGFHADVAVFFFNQNAGATPAIQLILHDCAARVADVNTSLVQVIAVDVEIFIHGTFKTNSTNLSSWSTAGMTVMTGTLELGEPTV